jgi:uncharacterized protein (TIGR03083 family)
LTPIDARRLFAPEREALLEVLGSLGAEEWQRPTACPGWSVADVARHVLWGDVSYLSRLRDGYAGPPRDLQPDVSSWQALVSFINDLNDSWLRGTRRMSPALTTTLLRATGAELAVFQEGRELLEPGVPVDWAGEGPAPVWLDIAREYAERWVHQQHIRDAVDRPGLTDRRFMFPVLDAFVRTIPHALRDIVAAGGPRVQLRIIGAAGGTWTVVRDQAGWRPSSDHAAPVAASVTMDQDLAWRLFTKGISVERAQERIAIVGDPSLVEPLIRMVAIIA